MEKWLMSWTAGKHIACVTLNYVCDAGSFEKEALENEDRSTKHPNLENEAPYLENEAPKSRCPL